MPLAGSCSHAVLMSDINNNEEVGKTLLGLEHPSVSRKYSTTSGDSVVYLRDKLAKIKVWSPLNIGEFMKNFSKILLTLLYTHFIICAFND